MMAPRLEVVALLIFAMMLAVTTDGERTDKKVEGPSTVNAWIEARRGARTFSASPVSSSMGVRRGDVAEPDPLLRFLEARRRAASPAGPVLPSPTQTSAKRHRGKGDKRHRGKGDKRHHGKVGKKHAPFTPIALSVCSDTNYYPDPEGPWYRTIPFQTVKVNTMPSWDCYNLTTGQLTIPFSAYYTVSMNSLMRGFIRIVKLSPHTLDPEEIAFTINFDDKVQPRTLAVAATWMERGSLVAVEIDKNSYLAGLSGWCDSSFTVIMMK